MELQLITLQGKMLDTEVYRTTISTIDGEISVYPDHESLVTMAVPGVMVVQHEKDDPESKYEYIAISGGVVEIGGERLRILVDEADHGDDIIEAESRAALERALKMRDEASDQVELEKAHQMVDRHQVRLKVAELRRRKHH